MRESVRFGSREITFTIAYTTRKSLGITVTPEQEVKVIAPNGSPLEKIKEKVLKRAPWIIRQQSYFLSFHPRTAVRKYVSGETHLYLGRQYRLQVQIGHTESVKLKGKFLVVTASSKSAVKEVMDTWYKQTAKQKLTIISEQLAERFKKHKVTPCKIVFREMSTRWGSCTPQGKIILNPELIKAPKGCIEYVITHELCHLVHRDHNQKFFDLQSKEMKDWEKWKNKLERLMA